MTVLYSKDELIDRLFPIYFYRRNPVLACRDILGLDLSPHHSLIISDWFKGKANCDVLGSRGIGKTVILAIFDVLQSLLYAGNKIGAVGGGGMRQSKWVLLECEKIILCRLSGQREVYYAKACLSNANKVINKGPDFWSIDFTNGSQIFGMPIGNTGESIRGARTYKNQSDESFLIPSEIFQAVLEPMAYVKPDPTGKKKETISLQSINVSTVDHSERYFWKIFQNNRLKLQNGDDNVSSFEINYEDCFYDELVEGKKVRKSWWWLDFDKIEKAKEDTNRDLTIWLAENKDIPMDITGGYYPLDEIEKASHINFSENQKTDLFLQPLLGCKLPAVLGIDNAPTEANTAFVVTTCGQYLNTLDDSSDTYCKSIRYSSEEKAGCPFYDKNNQCKLKQHNCVIYAYEENKMSLKDRVKIVFDILKNFNIMRVMADQRGGGWEVAELLRDKEVVSKLVDSDTLPLIDPNDERNIGLSDNYDNRLRLIATDGQTNTKFNAFVRGLLTNKKLVFPKIVRFAVDSALVDEYEASKNLLLQLARIKAKSLGAWLSFDIDAIYVEGKRRRARKDLYSALILACGGINQLIDELGTVESEEEVNNDYKYVHIPVNF